MKTISRISAFIALFVAAVSCSSGKQKALLPNVSGKAGEVIIAMDKDNWEGDLGNEEGTLLIWRRKSRCSTW